MRSTFVNMEQHVDFDVGSRLKRLREYFRLTQLQMADRANIDYKYYGRLERNESTPTIAVIEKICKGLDISLIQFFMPSSKTLKNDLNGEFNVQKIQAFNIGKEIDIHFNRDALLAGCSNCIWYNGYLASAYLDEYELKLSVEGNVRANVYIDYSEVASINNEEAGCELLKYVNNDEELRKLLIREEYTEETLQEYRGTVIFVPESNWITLSLINHRTRELVYDFELDTDNIFEPFLGKGVDIEEYFFP